MRNNKLLLLALTLIALGIGVAAFTIESLVVVLVLSGVVYVLAITVFFLTKRDLFSLAGVFMAFSFLYGIVAPLGSISAVQGYSDVFGGNLHIREYLIGVNLVHLAMMVALLFSPLQVDHEKTKIPNIPSTRWQQYAMIFAILGGFGEASNLVRVGFDSLLQGKAVYKSAVGALTLTFPADIFMQALFALLPILILKGKISKNRLLIIFILSLPYFAINTFVGERGNLLGLLIIALISYSINVKIKINFKILASVVAIYLLMSSLFLLRNTFGVAIERQDYTVITSRFDNENAMMAAFNPATTEFGAPMGNFSIYLSNPMNDEPFYGETYLTGVLNPVPLFIYANKPQQIAYRFRDYYFVSESLRARTAGTGFSSILEAYMNFGWLGVIIVHYLVYALLLQLDRLRISRNEIYLNIFFALNVNWVMIFFRSDFGTSIIGGMLMAVVMTVFIRLMDYILSGYKNNEDNVWVLKR